MAKFCGKCGAKLDENTGKCPNCEAEKSEKVGQKKIEKRKCWSTGKKIRRLLLKILVIILLFGIIAGGIVGGLTYFGIMDIPFAGKIMDNFGLNDQSDDIEKNIPETDTTGFSYYQSSGENMVEDTETGIEYVNNEILITLTSKKYKTQLKEYLKIIGGNIVGELPELSEYQVLLNQSYAYSDIEQILNDIKKVEGVSSVSPNYVLEMDEAYIPDDKKWKNKWEDVPEGNNWGMEAIDAPGAWEYQSEFQEVNIGVIDGMFDIAHEDLDFAEIPWGNSSVLKAVKNKDLKWSSHGTHVAGTIAATFDNNLGVAGVATKTNLYGVSDKGLCQEGKDPIQAWKAELYYLIVEKKCSVINISMGFDQLAFEASRGEKVATEMLDNMAKEFERELKQLIDEGYPFVICKAAGNQNEVGGDYQYFRKDSDDETTKASYYFYKDYQEYKNGNKEQKEHFDRYKKREKEIKSRLESGNVDAKYDVFGAIENEEVKNRIIMVGAAENLGTHREGGFLGIGGKKVHNGYTITAFSQCGKQVDVIAPGVDIYSTIKNGYGKMSGTSMAAPHVTGTVGLIFSVNPNIKADKIKKIIKGSAEGEYGEEKYGLVNAKNAVEEALSDVEDEKESEIKGKFDKKDVPVEAVEFNGHYYYAYDLDNITTWEAAKQYCESRGGYLATITSPQEDKFVYSYLMNNFDYESAYFGFTDENEEGTWVWDNGEESSYTNWHYGEPNSENPEEDYAMYYYKFSDGTWNDGDFGNKTVNSGRVFICEWGEYEISSNIQKQKETRTISDERDIVLVLDASSSMAGTPLDETKKAATNL